MLLLNFLLISRLNFNVAKIFALVLVQRLRISVKNVSQQLLDTQHLLSASIIIRTLEYMLAIDYKVLEISSRDRRICFFQCILQRDYTLSRRVDCSLLSYFKRLASKLCTFCLSFCQQLQYIYAMLIYRSVENCKVSSSTTIDIRIIFLALGIPGQNKVCQFVSCQV